MMGLTGFNFDFDFDLNFNHDLNFNTCNIFHGFLGLFTLTIIFYTIKRFYIKYKFKRLYKTKQARVHPNGRFLSLKVITERLKKKKEGTLLEDTSKQFIRTDSNTFFLRLLGVKIFLTREPENIKAILHTQFNDFSLGVRYDQFKPALGDGIFTLDGEGWSHSRALLRPQFHKEQVSDVKTLEPHLQTLVEHINNQNGNHFDLQELFFRLTIDTATEFLFGESVYSLRDGTVSQKCDTNIPGRDTFADAFNIVQSYLATRSYVSFLYPFVNDYIFRKNTKQVHDFTQYFVKRALAMTPSELEEKSKIRYTFLYELLKDTRNPKELQDQLLNILLAGRDTTAGLLSFTFYELARNPRIYQKLRKSVIECFGEGEKIRLQDITFESLKKCEYLKFVVREGLRLYPSVPVNFRVSTKDTTLPFGGGSDEKSPIFISKGTTVAYSIHCTHRLKKYYGEDADEFRPERWSELKNVGWAYLPFNGGPRVCLGQQFALTEASYIIARLVQTFPELRSHDSGPYPPKKNVQLTSMLMDGAWVSFH